jgi:CBS domain containing-hemolysin-like protein
LEEAGNLNDLSPLVICITGVFLIGIFLSFLKTALAFCRKARLLILAEGGKKKYQSALELMEKTDLYRASLKAGTIVFQILLGCLWGILSYRIFMEKMHWGPIAGIPVIFVISLLFSVLFYILAESIPGKIARAAPEKITANFTGFIKIFSLLTHPLYVLDSGITSMLRKIFHSDDLSAGMTEDE